MLLFPDRTSSLLRLLAQSSIRRKGTGRPSTLLRRVAVWCVGLPGGRVGLGSGWVGLGRSAGGSPVTPAPGAPVHIETNHRHVRKKRDLKPHKCNEKRSCCHVMLGVTSWHWALPHDMTPSSVSRHDILLAGTTWHLARCHDMKPSSVSRHET